MKIKNFIFLLDKFLRDASDIGLVDKKRNCMKLTCLVATSANYLKQLREARDSNYKPTI